MTVQLDSILIIIVYLLQSSLTVKHNHNTSYLLPLTSYLFFPITYYYLLFPITYYL